MRPAGTSRFWRRSASSTSCTVSRYAASGRVEPDAHRVLALAADLHVGHARHRLQPRLDDAVDEVGELQRVIVSLV
jgi:hypothetical protein